jgi:hypothetical protein
VACEDSGEYAHMRRASGVACRIRTGFRALVCTAAVWPSVGQITTGVVECSAGRYDGSPRANAVVRLKRLPSGPEFIVTADNKGRFTLVLPYGDYQLTVSGGSRSGNAPKQLHAGALRIVRCQLTMPETRAWDEAVMGPWWLDFRSGAAYFGSYSMAGALLHREPTTVSQPLDFAGLANGRRALLSQRAFSWTGTQYRLQGMDATDAYQPGFPVFRGDVQAIDEVTARSDLSVGASQAFGLEAGTFLRESASSDGGWHGGLSSLNTGALLASENLPSLATRNILQQSERYNWYTRDSAGAGGPIGKRADVFLAGTGQWSSQTVPIARQGQDQNSHLLLGNASGRVRLTAKDQIDALYSGSRIRLSDWGQPAGLETLLARRMAPTYSDVYGFSGLPEEDRFGFVQFGWTRQLMGGSSAGALQVRYGFSTAHLDTSTGNTSQPSVTDLLTGAVSGAAPLANSGERTRQEVQAAFLPGDVQWGPERHRIAIGGGWEKSNVRNRFSAPSDRNLITAAGTPASVVEFNGPSDSRRRIQQFSAYGRDEVRLAGWMWVDLGVVADFTRGSLPSRGELIAWNSLSPHAAFAITLPDLPWLIIRGSYSRRYGPLAGHYLDFGDPGGLSGSEYQWRDLNRDATFAAGEQGILLRRFGGRYSSISPSLRRPYADEFNVALEARLPMQSVAGIHLYRRDDKNRIAAINAGLPAQSFSPRIIADPGPDGIPGTFDDQQFAVYEQSPSTFGQDSFVLTNPSGLREQYEGFTAQVATCHKYADIRASFTAEKSWGPTNPGDGVLENDPGVVGALYMDPNTLVHATGRDFFDRGFVGKVETVSYLPAWLGKLELDNVVDYLDGLVFARQLLVSGLAQGPLVVAATVRGSPEGGNRAEYVLNWNLRLARAFRVAHMGNVYLAAELLNATNAANRVQESDIAGPAFNQRLPVAIQAPRFVRLGVRFDF